MNKAALITSGRKLQGTSLFLISVFDLEPSGVIVHAYNQIDSKEYLLPISEMEFATAGINRSQESLSAFLETIQLVPAGGEYVLQSTNEKISKIKRRPTGDEVEAIIKAPMGEGQESIHDLLTTGLVELCKVKPVGIDAVEWLGEWLLNNNPKQPRVALNYDVVEA